MDRKTARRDVQAAQAAGLARDAGPAALDDALIGAVIDVVRPARPNGHGAGWTILQGRRQDITDWVARGLSVVKIHELSTRSGTSVPYRTLHRFAMAECEFTGRGARRVTVRGPRR